MPTPYDGRAPFSSADKAAQFKYAVPSSDPEDKRMPIQGIVVHHTGSVAQDRWWDATAWFGSSPSAETVIGGTFNRTQYPAQFVIDADGKVHHVLFPESKTLATHIRRGDGNPLGAAPWLSNENTIGIEIAGANDGSFTTAQMAAAKRLILALAKDYGLDPQSDVFGHGEINLHKDPYEGERVVTAIRSDPAAGGNPNYKYVPPLQRPINGHWVARGLQEALDKGQEVGGRKPMDDNQEIRNTQFVQSFLYEQGVADGFGKSVVPNGDFDNSTREAVIRYQRAHPGLRTDGVVDRTTLQAMIADQAKWVPGLAKAPVDYPSPSRGDPGFPGVQHGSHGPEARAAGSGARVNAALRPAAVERWDAPNGVMSASRSSASTTGWHASPTTGPAPAGAPLWSSLRRYANPVAAAAAPSDDVALDDRLPELRRISRETPHLFTRDLEDEHVRLIDAKMGAEPAWPSLR